MLRPKIGRKSGPGTSSAVAAISFRSPPAQNAWSPAPVSTSTRASSSALKRCVAAHRLLAHRQAQGVAGLGPVDGDPGHRAVELVGDAQPRARPPPLRRARRRAQRRCRPGRPRPPGPPPPCRRAGARIVCSIFIASNATSGVPAVTAAPTTASTRTTVPGIGDTSEPGTSSRSGRGKRGVSVTARRSERAVDVHVRRTGRGVGDALHGAAHAATVALQFDRVGRLLVHDHVLRLAIDGGGHTRA